MAWEAWERLPGTSRRYRNIVTGETISRREYMKRVEGIIPEAKAEARRAEGKRNPLDRYSRLANDYRKQKAKELNISPKDVKIRGDNPTARELKELKKALRSKDNSANSKKARALVRLGRREADWPWDVGESPTK